MVLWLLIDLGAYIVNAANRALKGTTVDKPLKGCSGGACAYQPPPGSKTKADTASSTRQNIDNGNSQAFSEATAQSSGEMQRYGR